MNRKRRRRVSAAARQEGAKLVVDGRDLKLQGYENGFFLGGCVFDEVKPEMRCVWVQAWEGSKRMAAGARILEVQKPVDNRLKGHSAWLKLLRDKTETAPAAPAAKS